MAGTKAVGRIDSWWPVKEEGKKTIVLPSREKAMEILNRYKKITPEQS